MVTTQQQILILVPLLGASLFIASTDLLSLTDADLSLLALNDERKAFIKEKQEKGKGKGLDKLKGHFKDPKEKTKGKACPPPKGCTNVEIDPDTGDVKDTDTGQILSTVAQVQAGGGGALGSTVGLEGFQVLIREDVQIFPAIRSPVKGQSILGTVALEWIGENPLIVTHAQFGKFDDLFTYSFAKQIPQNVFAENPSDEIKKGEFVFQFTLPEDFDQEEFIIPVRMIVDTGEFTHNIVSQFEIEAPLGIITSFSFAEVLRSFLAFLRVG